ncbi:MAG: BPSL0067 family protein, partial [Acetobacteraceae bacterium]|nr:BPSL0067 family protein [Acetobacteraceae bacterium]
RVQGNTSLQPGTVIATFNKASRYANALDGSSHAAIYLGQNTTGVQVLDQWAGSRAAVRTIPWHNPGGAAANTGSAFHVVRTG